MLKAVEVVSHEKLLWRFLNHCNIFPDFPALSNLLPAWLQICQNAGLRQKFWFHQVCSSMADMDDMGDSLGYRYQIPKPSPPNVATVDTIPVLSPPLLGRVWHSLSHSLWLYDFGQWCKLTWERSAWCAVQCQGKNIVDFQFTRAGGGCAQGWQGQAGG